MTAQRNSGLRFYSLGIVVNNKGLGTDMIDVDPIEDFSLDNGKIKPDSRQYSVSLPDHKGVTKSSGLIGGSVIQAKWLAFGHSNRDTAPDVRCNETVMLFQFADTQDYYWTTIMREPEIRRLEKVRYVYCNLPEGFTPYNGDTSYWFEVSTVDQHVKLHTSDNNDEKVAYDIIINTKEGNITIKDNNGNSIYLDSVAGDLITETTASVQVKTQRFSIDASQSVEINTPNFTVNASSEATITTSKLGFTGNSSASLEGDFDITGTVDVTGSVTATGSIIDGGGNTPNHSH